MVNFSDSFGKNFQGPCGHVSCRGPVFFSPKNWQVRHLPWSSQTVSEKRTRPKTSLVISPVFLHVYTISIIYLYIYIYIIYLFIYLCGVEPDKTKVYKLHNNLLVNINSDRNRFQAIQGGVHQLNHPKRVVRQQFGRNKQCPPRPKRIETVILRGFPILVDGKGYSNTFVLGNMVAWSPNPSTLPILQSPSLDLTPTTSEPIKSCLINKAIFYSFIRGFLENVQHTWGIIYHNPYVFSIFFLRVYLSPKTNHQLRNPPKTPTGLPLRFTFCNIFLWRMSCSLLDVLQPF